MALGIRDCDSPGLLPVIFLPGIMGSKVRRGTKILWDEPTRPRQGAGWQFTNAGARRNFFFGDSGNYYELDTFKVAYQA